MQGSNTQAQSNLAPLRPNTRERIQSAGNPLPAAFGTTQSLTFPQVGLMQGIFVYANLTITDSAASPAVTASTFGPYNLIKRISGNTNLGTATVFDLSGYGAYLVSKVTDTALELKAANADTTADAMYQFPTTFTQNVAKPVQFVLYIPVSANNGPQFSIGMINLQASELRFTLSIQFGQASDAYTTSDTLTLGGNVFVYYRYFEVPNPDEVQLPPKVLHRLLEDRQGFASTGDVTMLIPRMGVLLQAIHNVILNGAISKNSTDVVSRKLVFNGTDTAYKFDYIVDRILNRIRYGLPGGSQDLPGGAFVWDFFNADQAPSRGDLRDALDTESLSTLQSVITIASGATLGTGTNFVDTVRRITQQY